MLILPGQTITLLKTVLIKYRHLWMLYSDKSQKNIFVNVSFNVLQETYIEVT